MVGVGGLLALSVSPASATNFIVNGGFDGFLGNTNHFNSTVPSGWTTLSLSPDTFSGSTNFDGYQWSTSPSGGHFLHGIGFRSGGESAYQILSGLAIGTTYEFSFEQSISRSFYGSSSGRWIISVGGVTQYSSSMTAPTSGAATWQSETLYFTAAAATAQLTLTAQSTSDGSFGRSEMGIDGLYFGGPRTSSVPESGSTVCLIGGALLGLIAGRRALRS